MGTVIVVDGDAVEGTDTHNVSGLGTLQANPTVPGTKFMGTAEFDYKGSMTDALSDFVSVGGKALALISSESSLDSGEDSIGGHGSLKAKNITPIPPPPIVKETEMVDSITDSIGTGTPSSGTGSTFVKVGGDAVLLDGDAIDTCDGMGATGNSTVTASEQDFVCCSE